MTIGAHDLLVAFAHRLAGSGVADFDPVGMYQPDQVGVVFEVVPDTPTSVVVLSVYDRQGNRNPRLTNEMVYLQARVRTGPRAPVDVHTLAEAVHAQLETHREISVSGAVLPRVHRISYIPMGRDSKDRPEISLNYEVVVP